MSIVKFSHPHPYVFDRLFRNPFLDWTQQNEQAECKHRVPSVNIRDEEATFHIDMAAPGLKKEDFSIEVNKDILSITSKTTENKEQTEEHYTRKEFSFSSFNRSFTLPETADKAQIHAKYENGILEIIIPKKEEKKEDDKKQISIA